MRERAWLIVGSGFTGATVARCLAESGHRALVVERRAHVGGNAYDERDGAGLTVHRYGPHLFHTNSERVWRFLSRFTSWRPYEHRVRVAIDGQHLPLPINLTSIRSLLPDAVAARASAALTREHGDGANVPLLTLRASQEPSLRELAEVVYHRVFLNYTLKHWGLAPEQLDPSVTARVPVRNSHDDRYFQDRFQAMPAHGYAALFAALLDHPSIEVLTGTGYAGLAPALKAHPTVYTGPIDELLGYRHGALPYRSLRLEAATLDQETFQEAATVNHPDAPAMTRITEWKHLTGERSTRTSILREYPQAHTPGRNEPYYPVPAPFAHRLLARYQADAAAELKGRVWLAGRLGDYQYYNMDQACARGLSLFEKQLRSRLDDSA